MKQGITLYSDQPASPSAKWVPGHELLTLSESLFEAAQDSSSLAALLPIPLLVTLATCLEATINDYLILDTYAKHGGTCYRAIVEGYMRIPFTNKLRAVVPILTDNTFQLREGTPTLTSLDQLIVQRNKLAHTKAMILEVTPEIEANPPAPPGLLDHPLATLSIAKCHAYLQAIRGLHRGFFDQYDSRAIVENDLIEEVPRFVHPGDAA
jgi:hypothetical protein